MNQSLQYTRTLRALPLWLLREYLEDLGGSLQQDGSLRGDGWTAWLGEMDDFQIGSLRVGQVRLEICLEPVTSENFIPALEKKLLRAGG